uniref:Uncharacterized protein n=1 Tax=Glossina palpalis gambiensis TaxID=67801 RepID=A0A1B0BMX8_9MUSC
MWLVAIYCICMHLRCGTLSMGRKNIIKNKFDKDEHVEHVEHVALHSHDDDDVDDDESVTLSLRLAATNHIYFLKSYSDGYCVKIMGVAAA